MAMSLSKKHSQTASAASQHPEFEQLFQDNWNKVCTVLYRILGDWDEAEDLALEVFEKFYRQPPARTGNTPAGWFYRVATNLGLNALRARKRRQRYEIEAGTLDFGERYSINPADAVEWAQEQQRVRTALQVMKPRLAQVLVLRHSGLSYAEVAAAMDVAPSSVGTLLARAEAEFARRYQEQGGENAPL